MRSEILFQFIGIALTLPLSMATAGDRNVQETTNSRFENTLKPLDSLNHQQQEPARACEPPSPEMVPVKPFVKLPQAAASIRKASQSVRRLCVCDHISLDACSTVVAVDHPGMFVTNQHVLDFIKSARKDLKCQGKMALQLADGTVRLVELKVLKEGKCLQCGLSKNPKEKNNDDHADMALLELKGAEDVPFLKVAKQDARLGQKVYNMGFPLGPLQLLKVKLDDPYPYISDGKVTSIREENVTADFIGMNGMSGGAVVSETGELVGIFWGHERASPYEKFTMFWLNSPPPTLPKTAPREESYFIPRKYTNDFVTQGSRK
jgi:S1-C subfamily serine protease